MITMFGRPIAEKALADLKAARAANGGELPLEMWLDRLGKSIDQGFEEYFERDPAARVPRKEFDALFSALATACGFNLKEMTHPAKREVAVALAQIRGIAPKVTASEITERAQRYKMRWPSRELAPIALSKWWSAVGPAKKEFDIYDEPPLGWQEALVKVAGPEYAGQPWESIRVQFGRRIWQSLG